MLWKTIFGDACFDWKTWPVLDTGNEPRKVNVLLFFIILVAFCNFTLSAYAFDAFFPLHCVQKPHLIRFPSYIHCLTCCLACGEYLLNPHQVKESIEECGSSLWDVRTQASRATQKSLWIFPLHAIDAEGKSQFELKRTEGHFDSWVGFLMLLSTFMQERDFLSSLSPPCAARQMWVFFGCAGTPAKACLLGSSHLLSLPPRGFLEAFVHGCMDPSLLDRPRCTFHFSFSTKSFCFCFFTSKGDK